MLTESQQEIRASRLTGSTIAPLLGYSPYVPPMAAWLDSQHLARSTNKAALMAREQLHNPDIQAGVHLEAAIMKWVADDLGGLGALTTPGTLVMNEMFGATPDFISAQENVGIQVKNHRPQIARSNYKGLPGGVGKWDNNLVPLHILIQCQWEMLICNETGALKDCDRWILACFFGGGDRRVYWLKRDRQLQDSLMFAGAVYWTDHWNPKGPLLPPKDWPWAAQGVSAYRRGRKLPAQALEAAPIPFAEPFKPSIPFGAKP